MNLVLSRKLSLSNTSCSIILIHNEYTTIQLPGLCILSIKAKGKMVKLIKKCGRGSSKRPRSKPTVTPGLRLYGNFKLTRRFSGFEYIQYKENIFQKVTISKFQNLKICFFKMHFLCL